MIGWIVEELLAKYNYWVSIILILIGFYAMIAKSNLIKKIIGLSIFQTAIFLFFISLGDIGPLPKGTAPIVSERIIHIGYVYTNPLPSVLILTAIVVALGTTAVVLALVIRMYEEYGTIEDVEIMEKERERERRRERGTS